jgi:tetratricopeptide (TPR) repeat protein
MNVTRSFQVLASAALAFAAAGANAAGDFGGELASLQNEWAAANYEATAKNERAAAFAALVEHAAALRAQHPERVEALAWEGIVLSTYAGEVGAMSAMKYAKAARDALHRAERLDSAALGGGVYASLGALYSKVPGGLMGFGDEELAERYFRKALAVDPDGIDNNYFYGEFLLEQGNYAEAVKTLEHALEAPPAPGRPVFDAGRRNEIRELLAAAQRKSAR